jgi:hypothetical protein
MRIDGNRIEGLETMDLVASCIGRRVPATATLLLIVTGCSATSIAPPQGATPPAGQTAVRHGYGVGPIVHPKVTGTIVGFDLDQHGSDGVLANCCGPTMHVSLETFDQTTGKITGVVGKGGSGSAGYEVYGILAGDVGFVSHKDYELMNPVTGEKLNEKWVPPASFTVDQIAENQSTPEQAIFGYDSSDITSIVAGDIVRGTAKRIRLDQDYFGIGASPVIAEDPVTHQAVVIAQDGGLPNPPTIGIVDLRTGKTAVFQGLGDGDADGIGIDSKTGTVCTTTGGDAGVEFYDLKTQMGFEVQIPNSGGSELLSGSSVAVDDIHGLCIVTQPVTPEGTQGPSAIWVVDEKGSFLEEIPDFHFWFGAGLAINPKKRIGFVVSPRPEYETLTGFSY